MQTIPEMFVPEDADDVRTCRRLNQVAELAYVLGKTEREINDQARNYIRPAGHPRGRQYMSDAVAELYAGYRINAPHLFTRAKAPVLSSLLSQIRSL